MHETCAQFKSVFTAKFTLREPIAEYYIYNGPVHNVAYCPT